MIENIGKSWDWESMPLLLKYLVLRYWQADEVRCCSEYKKNKSLT